jgi:hypothetical protein
MVAAGIMLLAAHTAGAQPAKLLVSVLVDEGWGKRLERRGVPVNWLPPVGYPGRAALVPVGTVVPPKDAWREMDGEPLAPDFVKALVADLRNQAMYPGPGPYDSHVVDAFRQEIEYEIRAGAPSRGLLEVTAPVSDWAARFAVAGIVAAIMRHFTLPPFAGFLVGQVISLGQTISGMPPQHDPEQFRARRHKGLTAAPAGGFFRPANGSRRPRASGGGGQTDSGSTRDRSGGSGNQPGNSGSPASGGEGTGGVRGGRDDGGSSGSGQPNERPVEGSGSGGSGSGGGNSGSGGGDSGSGGDNDNSGSGGNNSGSREDSSNVGATNDPGLRDGGPDASGVVLRFPGLDPGPFGPEGGENIVNDTGLKLREGMSEAEIRAKMGELKYMDVTGDGLRPKMVKTKTGPDGKERPDLPAPTGSGTTTPTDLEHDVRGAIYGTGYEPVPPLYKDPRIVSPIDPPLAPSKR